MPEMLKQSKAKQNKQTQYTRGLPSLLSFHSSNVYSMKNTLRHGATLDSWGPLLLVSIPPRQRPCLVHPVCRVHIPSPVYGLDVNAKGKTASHSSTPGISVTATPAAPISSKQLPDSLPFYSSRTSYNPIKQDIITFIEQMRKRPCACHLIFCVVLLAKSLYIFVFSSSVKWEPLLLIYPQSREHLRMQGFKKATGQKQ